MRYYISTSLLLLTLWLCACTTPTNTVQSPVSDQASCRAGESILVHDRLYFGTRTPDGVVSDPEWADFLREVITPRFPAGLTVITGIGQWQSDTGEIIQERSHILSLVYSQAADKESKILEIVRTYKNRFNQESVLRVRNATCASFH